MHPRRASDRLIRHAVLLQSQGEFSGSKVRRRFRRLVLDCVRHQHGRLRRRLRTEPSGEHDGQVRDRQQHERRYCGDRSCECRRNVGVSGDDRVDRVGCYRDRGTGHEQQPRIPGGTLPRERDDGHCGNDDDAVHDERPCPRLALIDAGASREVGERRERQPEGGCGDEYGPSYRRPHGDPPARLLHAAGDHEST